MAKATCILQFDDIRMHRLISAPLMPMDGRHSPRWAAWWRRSWCRPPSPWSPPESCSGWEPSQRRRRCWRWSRGRWRCRTRRRSPPGSVTSRWRKNSISSNELHGSYTVNKRCFIICIKIEYSHSYEKKRVVRTDSYTETNKAHDVLLIKGICRRILEIYNNKTWCQDFPFKLIL